jgi:ATP-binding cassette subfamily B protein
MKGISHAPELSLSELRWPFARAMEAMECLAGAAGLSPRRVLDASEFRPEVVADAAARNRHIEALSEQIGVDVQAVSELYPELSGFVRRCAPALLSIGPSDAPELLAVLRASEHQVELIAPSGRSKQVSVDALRTLLSAQLETPVARAFDALLDSTRIPHARRKRAHRALVAEKLAHVELELGWLLRAANARAPSRSLYASSLRSLAGMLALYSSQYLLMGWAWRCAGSGALQGRIDPGWLAAWLLALASTVPLQTALSWLTARLTLNASAWLRVRMLDGILRQDPHEIRRIGSGQLLSRVLDAGALESLGLGGGFMALLASVDLVIAGFLLAAGVAASTLLVLFGALLVGSVSLAALYFARRRVWTGARLDLTHDLVERMMGHRTRIVQESPEHWHDGEDSLLVPYAEHSRSLDRITTFFSSMSRVWLLLALGCITPTFLADSEYRLELAITLGGILIASRAFASLSTALGQICSAIIAWEQVASLVGPPKEEPLPADPSVGSGARQDPSSLLEVHDLTITAPGRSEPLLAGADFVIRKGDSILFEGRSGSGKSSFARVLSGSQRPERGLLLSSGLDPHSLGTTGWNRRVALAPQFNDNHVLSASFAFNVLLGRHWPPRPEELSQAEAICRELGLGDLLDRMPAGMLQIVGETGWQLSHGERTRLFAARALVSEAELVILDESAAALDPASAEVVLECARRRSQALLLIAHP